MNNCGGKMRRLYMKIDGKYKGVGNGCLRCGRTFIDGHTAFDKAWQVLKRGGN